jgi:hypothetical protein
MSSINEIARLLKRNEKALLESIDAAWFQVHINELKNETDERGERLSLSL